MLCYRVIFISTDAVNYNTGVTLISSDAAREKTWVTLRSTDAANENTDAASGELGS